MGVWNSQRKRVQLRFNEQNGYDQSTATSLIFVLVATWGEGFVFEEDADAMEHDKCSVLHVA
jgi:hypothetical protein